MRNTRLLRADNRYHTRNARPLPPSSGWGNEFDYDDPPMDLDIVIEEVAIPFSDEAALRFLRDFILETTLYVSELESHLGAESSEFWEAREHAYHVVSELLIAVYQYLEE